MPRKSRQQIERENKVRLLVGRDEDRRLLTISRSPDKGTDYLHSRANAERMVTAMHAENHRLARGYEIALNRTIRNGAGADISAAPSWITRISRTPDEQTLADAIMKREYGTPKEEDTPS